MWTDNLSFSVDWVTLRVDCDNWNTFIDGFCELVGITDDKIISIKPRNFYRHSYAVSVCGASIVFSHSADLESLPLIPTEYSAECTHYGILVNISGDGCRFLDSVCENGLMRFLQFCSQWNCNCTRIDTCMDIFERENPIYPLFTRFFDEAYSSEKGRLAITSNIRRGNGWITKTSNFDHDTHEITDNITIGKRTACGMCVLYNKKLEMLSGRLAPFAKDIFEQVGCTDYWYRLEYRAQNDRLANECFAAAVYDGAEAAFAYMVEELFTFVHSIYDDSHLSCCPVDEVWQEFLDYLGDVAPSVKANLV